MNNMFSSGYFMYMAEAEGCDYLISTRTAKINAIIKDLKYIISQNKDPNDYVKDVCLKHNLPIYDLTQKEQDRINEALNG